MGKDTISKCKQKEGRIYNMKIEQNTILQKNLLNENMVPLELRAKQVLKVMNQQI